MSNLWHTIPFFPLLAAIALLLTGQRARAGIWLSCVPALAAALAAPPAIEPAFLWPGATWGADTVLQRGLLGGSAMLWLFAGVFSLAGPKEEDRSRLAFQLFWLISLSGNLLWLIAGDALSFYVGFSMMSLSAYGLIVHRRTIRVRQAGRLYLQIAVTGEMLLLTGLMLAWHESGGSFLFSVWREADFTAVTLLALIAGLALKAGFWPLHVWMPQAYPSAPPAAGAVLSGAMTKAGIAGLWMLLPAESPLLQQWSIPLLWLGLINLFYGALVGLVQRSAGETLAFSSVSQMGFLMVITAMAWHAPELRPALMVVVTLYIVHHGLAKGALFMATGLLAGGQPAGALARGLIAAGIALPALAIGGLPFTTGAAVKTALKDQLPAAGLEAYTLAAQLGALASTLIMLRALWLLRKLAKEDRPRERMSALHLIGWSVPACACLVLPWLWPPMRAAAFDSLALYKLGELAWPMAVAAGLAVMAWRLRWQPPGIRRSRNPALHLSLYLRRMLQRPPVPAPDPEEIPPQRTRRLERRWNHWWPRSTINNSIWLLLIVLVAASLYMTF
ncbi:MAG: proton-conducting transporter membrane subunit [Pseudohongiellaceae bacterium]